MHQERQKDYIQKFGRFLAVVLPAVGIIALSGCVREFCSGWMSRLPADLFDHNITVTMSAAEDEAQPTATVMRAASDAVVASAGFLPAEAELTAASPAATVKGCGLYIDGQFYGAYSSASSLRSILDSFKALYASGAKGEIIDFTRDIQLVEGTYPARDLLTYSGIKSVLESKVTETYSYVVRSGDTQQTIAAYYGMPADRFASLDLLTYSGIKSVLESKVTETYSYVVRSGDTQQTIAAYYGMPADRFASLNGTIAADELTAGNILEIEVEELLVQVACTRQVTETVSIPFSTEIVEGVSASGKAEIITQGVNGSKTVTANVVTVNGRETERVVLSEKVLVEPVTQTMTEGVQNSVSYSASYYGETGSGLLRESLIWPLPDNGGAETCKYGEDGHQGVDLAIDAGTDIYAAASGTVVVAGWYYTYGNCVIIDHGNGVRTLYAHCSSLDVSVGEEVTKGQVVGKVGMTGYATGNHLHFEVHINNRTYDPFTYIAR